MTRPHILLRIASIFALLFAAGHTAGAPWTPAKELTAMGFISVMKSLHFDVMGNSRTYFDFYYGFGVSISVYLIAQAIIMWQVGEIAKTNPALARPIMLTLIASNVAVGVITVMYFFAAPIVLSAVICGLLAWAWYKAGR